MSEDLKKKLLKNCTMITHVDFPIPPDPEFGCMNCSREHVEEFGDCEGIVGDLMDFNNEIPPDPDKIGPEVNVYWQPSNLRYGYHPNDLVKV